MLIRNKAAFSRGLLLMGSFIIVFIIFFLEVFPGSQPGQKTNGLVFADHLFNTLAKGSSNFFDNTAQDRNSVNFRIQPIKGRAIDVLVPFKENQGEMKVLAAQLVKAAGLEVTESGNGLQVKGDLHTLLLSIIKDSASTFENNSATVAERYGMPADKGLFIMRTWWNLGNNMIKPLQKQHMVQEANAVSAALTRAIEPSFNFYGIEALRVADNIPLVAGFLIFYVVYTMWYGFAIFELFEGIGLTMKKSVKKEV
ncbi:hypothetical protein [Desulfovibrio cuneatus]|uniref:hypothetical protein n=1 Tax=Desulfovibrio cuneatus TaxID=159728 RepID=UPI00041048D7|nr:hypothetical protein [Desulfovibrio cuneatus]